MLRTARGLRGDCIFVHRRQLAVCHQMQCLVISLFSGVVLDNNSGVNLVVSGDMEFALWSCGHKYEHLYLP